MNYELPLLIYLLSLVSELVISLLFKQKNNIQKYIATISISLVMFSATTYLIFDFKLFTVLLLMISLFRVINLSRIVVARLNSKELYKRYVRSAFWLDLFSIIAVYLIYTKTDYYYINDLLFVSTIGTIILLITTMFSLYRWRSINSDSHKLKDIPTVSICIPARNETQDLPECIEAALSSSYPKLEILVLDDCSHDKTPAIIKKYAHSGVRFIKGQEPGANWIAKNSAMNKLFLEARGDIVVFAGVDVRFSPNTIQGIVELLENESLDMMSVLPLRKDTAEFSVFIQPLRYWWELAVPRIFGKRPPALSTLWAIRSKKLKSVGDFESVKKSIRPEAHFARRLKKTYRFILSGNRLGVTSVKKPREQFDTALRMRYPQARRRPESVLALIVIEAIIVLTPLFTLIYGLYEKDSSLISVSILSSAMLIIINLYISALTVRTTWLVGLVSLPFLIVEEWYILIRSMLAYEFGDVIWKERNICLPMLQVEKELPKL